MLLGINKSAKVEQYSTTTPSKDGKKDQGDAKTAEEGGGSSDKDKKDKKEAAEPGSTASAPAMATATLAVTPSDALKLAVASQTGTLSLALRPVIPKETIVLDTKYVNETDDSDDSGDSGNSGNSGSSGNYDDSEDFSSNSHYNRTYAERVAAYSPQAAPGGHITRGVGESECWNSGGEGNAHHYQPQPLWPPATWSPLPSPSAHAPGHQVLGSFTLQVLVKFISFLFPWFMHFAS